MSVDPDPKKIDWHPADVLAALKKRGKTLSGLSRDHGYHATAAGKALKRPWPVLEALIAADVGVQASLKLVEAGTTAPGNAADDKDFICGLKGSDITLIGARERVS